MAKKATDSIWMPLACKEIGSFGNKRAKLFKEKTKGQRYPSLR